VKTVFVILFLGLMSGVGAAEARTPEQAAQNIARKRNYTPAQTVCFTEVYKRFASLNRRGNWIVAGDRRRGTAEYRRELWDNCRISR
jgi:hypothetical protein